MNNIITMIHNALARAEEAIEKTDQPEALRLMNTSYFVGQVHGLLDIVFDSDSFVEIYDDIRDRLHTITKKEDEIYRKLR